MEIHETAWNILKSHYFRSAIFIYGWLTVIKWVEGTTELHVDINEIQQQKLSSVLIALRNLPSIDCNV